MFRKLLLSTIVAVFFLIFIGSVVRTTGAGMGCPDWPKCFGKVIPPTNVGELPQDYIAQYKQIRIKKNIRLESVFKLFGLESVLYDKQKNHKTYNEVTFDVTNAWIEYLNRIVGVLVGFLVLGVFLMSFRYFKSKLGVVLWSGFALFILLLEAFLGSVVVSTNLFPELISVHMVLALFLVFILMYIYFVLFDETLHKVKTPPYLLYLSFFVLGISFVQLYLGIHVREKVDVLHHQYGVADGVIDQIGVDFYVHRSFSIVLIIANIFYFFHICRYGLNNRWARLILPILFIEIFTGVTLAKFDLPRFSQPFHLLLASLLIGMQFMNFLYLKFASQSDGYIRD